MYLGLGSNITPPVDVVVVVKHERRMVLSEGEGEGIFPGSMPPVRVLPNVSTTQYGFDEHAGQVQPVVWV